MGQFSKKIINELMKNIKLFNHFNENKGKTRDERKSIKLLLHPTSMLQIFSAFY